ncbi:MAG: Crp/Fnr family transcriptional regulator [Roseiarcus sp.]|jgi:CRP-like cAMP-binding protein
MRSDQSLLARKIGAFVHLSERELRHLARIESPRIRVARGKELVHEGQTGHVAHIIHAGWACSFKLLPDGGRQIIAFPIPGDCVGLRSMLLRTSDHSFSALTDATVSRVDAASMREIFSDLPRLGAAILWATSRDEAMLVEHLVSIGRRNAVGRTAHFFLELHDRLKLVGLARDDSFACPLNQNVLSDALGLSAIHVNRVLRQLRERGLMTFRDRLVTVHDAPALKALSGYENHEDDAIVIREGSAIAN